MVKWIASLLLTAGMLVAASGCQEKEIEKRTEVDVKVTETVKQEIVIEE